MKTFKNLYRIVATIFTILFLWLVFIGIANGNFVQVCVSVLVCILLWVGAFKAGNRNNRDIVIACGLPALISLPLVYRLFQRAIFVFENGGMERADGYGSPLAFIIGLSFELALLILLLFLFLVGFWYLARGSVYNA
ncbi:hypothetical protein [Teredinibacter turnerae]|uniref:hypothetical protein n=1 Tax=Teredinibacter turnerae TaxID=2426 RepID=UPI0004907578|nr:hypothetical protein [Teredinibacter turnerae]